MAESKQPPLPQTGLAALKDVLAESGAGNTTNATGETSDATTLTQSTLPLVREKKIDAQGRAYGTGKRKSAIARVWIKQGKGQIRVNGRLASEYFASAVREMIIAQPFDATSTKGAFDVVCTVKGGGLSGQAGAVRHGIARALQAFDPGHREQMKPLGLLTRDARRVERKKFGRRKARRSFQFSKR